MLLCQETTEVMNAEGIRLLRAFLRSPFGPERWVLCDWLEENGATGLAYALRWAGEQRIHPNYRRQFRVYEWWTERYTQWDAYERDRQLAPGGTFALPEFLHNELRSKNKAQRRLIVRAFKRLAFALEKVQVPA